MAGELPTGLGNDQQATQATAFLRQQPWYLQWLQQNRITPGPDQQVHLNDQQREQLQQLVTSHGIGMNNKYDEIDENGQISEGHHKLRNTLIGAGIGAAALTGFGAAGIGPLAGALGGGAAAGGVGLGETAGGFGVGGLSATSLGVPATAGLGTAGGGAGILGTAGKFLGITNPKDPRSYLGAAGAIGDTLGAASQGAAQGRILQTELNQGQDRAAQDRYKTQITAPRQIAANSVQGDILANAQDFAWGAPEMVGNIPVPTSTGGLRPSIFSDNTRALGRRMSADALATPPPPDLTPMDEAGAGTSILNTAGAIGSFADLLNPNNYKSLIPSRRPPQGRVA